MHAVWIVVFLPAVYVCVLLYVLPELSKRNQFFAVTVAPSFRESEEARRILRGYRWQVVVHSILGLCGTLVALRQNGGAWIVVPILWPVAGSFVAVARAHGAALRHSLAPSGIRQASLQPRHGQVPGGAIGWAGPFAMLAAAAAYVRLHWNAIPARFPTHWGLDGKPNRWTTRSFDVYRPLLDGALICLLLTIVASQLARHARGSVATRNQTVRLLLGVSYAMAAIFGWLTVSLPLSQGSFDPTANALLIILLPLAIIGAILLFRGKDEPEPESDSPSAANSVLGLGRLPGDYTADRDWKGGLIYFNPDDPALFVEKRIGMGYDLNLGNPAAWVFMGVIVLIPVALVLTSKL